MRKRPKREGRKEKRQNLAEKLLVKKPRRAATFLSQNSNVNLGWKKNPSSIYLFSVCDDDGKNAKREKELKFKQLEDRLNKVCELELISQSLVK